MAIAELGAEDQVEIIWHSFQLDPDLPSNESYPSSAYLIERKGYLVEQVNAMCVSLADQVGLNAREARQVLESDDYAAQVEQDIARSRQLGIAGVPFFLIDGSQTIAGAQPDHIFKNTIESALEK